MTTKFVSSGVVSSGAHVSGGDELDILSGGKAVHTVLASGGVEVISKGGVASGTVVRDHATEYDYGRAFGTVVDSGGFEDVSKGGSASGTVVKGGGLLNVSSGGVATAVVASSGGDNEVLHGGVAVGTTISSGGEQGVLSAVVSSTVVSNGGEEFVNISGVAIATTVRSGGRQIVVGSASGTVVGSSGVVLIYGKASGTLVRSGGDAVINSGGVAWDSVAGDGGLVDLVSAARMTDTQVKSGGLTIVGGDLGFGTQVSSGGVEQVYTSASATVVSAGGLEEIFDGVAAATKVLSGGQLIVRDQGTASAMVIEAGASAVVLGGGVAAAAKVSGGTLTVSAVGQLSHGVTLEAGKVVISGVMSAFQAVKFTGSAGTLELDNLAGFQAKISGLATSKQKIDLGGFHFGAGETRTWTQAGTSGTLTVHDGAKTASLVLIGSYATSDFTLSDDGHGGTYIKDPRPARLVAGMAGLPGGRAEAIAVHAGGSVSATPASLARPLP
ncbi:MAG TPA: hypothetical protein VFE13_04645 [Caulobacteraceae bacterium]|nr:hypothetical protein [Caulobacteraceae bacterium]